MNRPPAHATNVFGLTRNSTGLTPAHVALIKMLAAKAVADFLAETEADEDDQEEAPR